MIDSTRGLLVSTSARPASKYSNGDTLSMSDRSSSEKSAYMTFCR